MDPVSASDAPAVPRLYGMEVRSVFAVVLTFVTGATDATSFVKLGGVFTSVMTGNMVLLGAAIGRGALSTVGRTVLAIVCYILGSMIGAYLAGRPDKADPPWPAHTNRALLVELVLFLGFGIGWWATGSAPSGSAQAVLMALCAVGLGIQSSAVLRLGVSGLSTTYLTGTLTTVVHALTTQRSVRGSERPAAILAALIIGGACGAAVATQAPAFAPVVLLAPIIAVIVAGHRHRR